MKCVRIFFTDFFLSLNVVVGICRNPHLPCNFFGGDDRVVRERKKISWDDLKTSSTIFSLNHKFIHGKRNFSTLCGFSAMLSHLDATYGFSSLETSKF